jgi:hypothetical protein
MFLPVAGCFAGIPSDLHECIVHKLYIQCQALCRSLYCKSSGVYAGLTKRCSKTYTLTDDPTRDQLEGSYVQTALQPRIDVMFVRMKSGGIAPSRLRLTHSDVLAECIAWPMHGVYPVGTPLPVS